MPSAPCTLNRSEQIKHNMSRVECNRCISRRSRISWSSIRPGWYRGLEQKTVVNQGFCILFIPGEIERFVLAETFCNDFRMVFRAEEMSLEKKLIKKYYFFHEEKLFWKKNLKNIFSIFQHFQHFLVILHYIRFRKPKYCHSKLLKNTENCWKMLKIFFQIFFSPTKSQNPRKSLPSCERAPSGVTGLIGHSGLVFRSPTSLSTPFNLSISSYTF